MFELNSMQMHAVSGGYIVAGGGGHWEKHYFTDDDGNQSETEEWVADASGGEGGDPGADNGDKLTEKQKAENASKIATAMARAEKAEEMRIPSDLEIAINKNTDAVKDNGLKLDILIENTTRAKCVEDAVAKATKSLLELNPNPQTKLITELLAKTIKECPKE